MLDKTDSRQKDYLKRIIARSGLYRITVLVNIENISLELVEP